jgi:hypothetical protein
MKKNHPTILTLLIILTLSACGPAPTPTLTTEEISNTAVADAWISITQTQAAIPTATITPIPTATFTPLPTFTLMPISTLAPLVSLASATASGGNPCYNPPPVKPKGIVVQVKLVNNSKGLVDLSLGMENPNTDGECATYFFRLGRYDQPVVSLIAACYWGYAYITDPTSNSQTIAPLCLNNTTKTVPVSIGKEVIGLQ